MSPPPLAPFLSSFLFLREGLQCIWGCRALVHLCSVSPGQFYLRCWCRATQRSRPSSRRWTTTAIPSPRTLTSPRASSRRAIFQVGAGSAGRPGDMGPAVPLGPLGLPVTPSVHTALAPDSEPHPCWERTRGLGSRSLTMLFLAARSGGVTLPPGLSAVIYFGSGNSDAVFLSPPWRPALKFRQDPCRPGGCEAVGAVSRVGEGRAGL